MRKVFKEIKDLGYSVYSEQGLITSMVTEFLTDHGKQKYDTMLEYHQKKLGAVELKDFESAAEFRDMERQLEREIMIDYMRKEGVANFRMLDREKKEILCYMYCEFLTNFFKIEMESSDQKE